MEDCGAEEDCAAACDMGMMKEVELLCEDEMKMEGDMEMTMATEESDPADEANPKISEPDAPVEKHISIVQLFSELEEMANITEDMVTSENGHEPNPAGKKPCPLCPEDRFKSCYAQKLHRHLQNLHWKISVEYGGYRMCICHLQCRPVKPNVNGDQTNIKMGAHYHCIICSATIFRRTDMISHMKRHVNKGETEIKFVSAVPAPLPGAPTQRYSEDILKEADTNFQVIPNYSTPQKTDSYFNPKMKSNRQLIFCALAVLAQERNPLECLDAFGSTGIMGLQWAKHLGSSIKVTINDINEKSVVMIRENCHLNKMKVLYEEEDEESEEAMEEVEESLGYVEVTMLDANVLMHLRAFDFIHLDPFGTTVNYLDAAFRNVRNLGIVSVTSTDISSLYGKALHVAKRHYGCNIVRTEYFREMAARIVIAAVARAAGRCNKGIDVLFSVALEHFILVVVRVLRGPTEADESAKKIRTLIHCQWCEDRIFKEGDMIGGNPYQQLPCNCHESMPGKSAIELGPMWSGTIFNTGFIRRMLYESVQHGIDDIQPLLKTLICEAECTTHKQLSITLSQCSQEESGVIIKTPDAAMDHTEVQQGKRKRNEMNRRGAKRRKSEARLEHPAFYYSIHRHSIRGMNIPKLNKLLQYLSQAGFQVSRTHFDPLGVRTNATLAKFKAILEEHSTSANTLVTGAAAAAPASVPTPPAEDVPSVEIHASSDPTEFAENQFLDDLQSL